MWYRGVAVLRRVKNRGRKRVGEKGERRKEKEKERGN